MSKTVTIPVEPPYDLLVSMAIRYDHAFGLCAHWTDEQVIELRKTDPLMGTQLKTKRERESILTTMRQLHEEVVGKGFYNYDV